MPFRKPFLIALILLTGGIVSGQNRYSAGDVVDNFTLTKFSTETEVELHDLEGYVIFLEWFAHWCPYCQAAAAATETGIVDYYDDRNGNTNGIPVKHVALNLQSGQETQTQEFIDAYGLGLVLNDFDRAVAGKFKSSGQPIFAIINGVEDSASHKQWELLYSLSNYGATTHPISTFRTHIDSVEAAANGDPVVTISGGSAITEGGNATFTLTATPAPEASLDVSVSVADDTASDFVASTNEGARTVAIPTGGTVSFTVATVNDEVEEANGSVTATVSSGTGYTVGTSSSASVTVNDDDGPPPPPPTPVVTISGGSAITEGGNASFTLTATPAPSASLSVSVNVADDTDSDFLASTNEGARTVAIPTTGTVNFTVTTENDEVDEANGSVSVTVSSGTGYTVGTSSSASVTVNDDDDPPPPPPTPVVTISGGSAITEGGNARFTLSATPAPSASLDVSVNVADDADSDFVASTNEGARTVAIPTGGTVSFTVPTVNDEMDEANGSVSATVSSGTGYTVGSSSSASVTVNDNDEPPPPPTPVVTITGGSAITEGGNARFTLTATPAPSASLNVSVNVADDADSDFVASGNEGARTVAIPTGGTVSFTVVTVDDELDEANGSISATVSSGTGYTVGTTSSASVTVNDDDEPPPPPTPVVTITGGSVITEGGNARFTLTATPAPSASLNVTVNVADDADSDFVASTNEGARTVAIPTTGTVSFTVVTVDDELDEANGSISATVSSGTGYTVGTSSSASVTVNDDDEPPPPPTPVVTITGGNAITEGGSARFTLTATPAPLASLDVSVSIADDTDSDFVASTNEGARTVAIPTTGTVSFTVVTVDDELDEANGSISATVSSGTGYTVGTSFIRLGDGERRRRTAATTAPIGVHKFPK